MPNPLLANLPAPIVRAIAPLLEALPLHQAMTQLVVTKPDDSLISTVESITRDPAIGEQSALAAGLWLYIDQLDRSHTISQNLPGADATGSFWHGIMHRREGDFSNGHYWFRRVGNHPAMLSIDADYDPHALIDQVEAAHCAGRADEGLIDLQRREWTGLLTWCATSGQ